MKNYCLSFVLCLLSFSSALAGEEITAERFPDADSVVVNEIERVKYNPDGTYEQTSESWTKILTEKGRREESTFSLDYSKRYGEAAIVSVAAIGADGVERQIDVSATMKESTDNGSMAANIYDPLDRKITCTIPSLKIGETLHVKTRRAAHHARWQNQWADLSVMEWTHPVLRTTFEVTAPPSRPLKQIAIRHPLGNVVTNLATLADGSLVYTFTATNSAQAFGEPDMPPMYTQVQNVRVSTAQNWRELSAWYWNLCAPHLAKTNAAMVAKARELVGGGDDSLRAIFKFVSQEVRYMGLTMEDTSPGWAPHDVDITFDNRYGVCRDKAALLVAMLRMAGFKAYPVLIHVGAKLDPEVPQPFFNHAIVAVECSSPHPSTLNPQPSTSYLLMDPTNENTKDLYPAYLGNNSYLVARPEGEDLKTSPVPSSEHNALSVVSTAKLSRDGSMFFEGRIEPKGINDTAYRGVLAKRTADERVKTFERILKSVTPGAELVKCEIRPSDLRNTAEPLSVSLAARLPEMVIRGKTRDELAVPTLSKSLGIVNWLLEGSTSLERRRFPLVLDTTACVRERLTLDLGEALGAVAELPRGAKTSGGYDYERTFAVTNGTLTMERSLSVDAVEFSPEAYQRLREEIKRVEAAERQKPTFVSDFTRDANLRSWLDSSETALRSDCEWVTTNVDVTEVLTYKGKKDVAELKFSLHPAWKNVELLSATVSNRNGKVYAVTPKEINFMDVGWASTAPRYPAGKTMVVNLPSVEIGSVVSVKTVVTVTNAPAPFYACTFYDSFRPVDRLVRRINGQGREIAPARRLPTEPSQPAGVLWRDCEIVSRGDWTKAAANLRRACEVPSVSREDLRTVEDCRNWMARYVKVAGPALYDLPLAQQLTDPERVLKERYATRLDYIRTLCALLKGVGREAEVVFAADNARTPPKIRQLDKFEKPDIRAFATALCRVRRTEGGFLGLGGTTTDIFLGTENEYTPIGATGFDGSDYFDPKDASFGVVRNSEARYDVRTEERCEIAVRENGAVDMTICNLNFGAAVGAFRKKFAEILPELRSRLYQSLLGGIAQAASATGELETDVTGYPAKTRFSCFVPDFATVSGKTISLMLPAFDENLPNLTGVTRETPVKIAGTDPQREVVVVRFPEGYTEIEHLPEAFTLGGQSPCALGGQSPWVKAEISSRIVDNAIEVTIVRDASIPVSLLLGADYACLVKTWRQTSSARANRTLTVRKP